MHLYHWDQIVEEQLNPLIFRKVIHCHSITMAKIRLSKGAVVFAGATAEFHRHEAELKGRYLSV